MSKVKITINNRVVEAYEGQTVLEAAKNNGIHIPTLCYLKGVTGTGACRVCQVEIEGAKTLAAACVYPVREGLVIKTNSQRALDARRRVVELIVSNHSKDCLSCIRNTNCELQRLCQELGVREDAFAGEKSKPTFDEVLNLIGGKVPILIEVKNTNKVGELETKLLETLRAYNGEYAIESFNPYVLEWFKNNAPDIWRGQLAGYFKGEKLAFIKKFALKRMLLNKMAKPDFIAYEASHLPNRFVRKYKTLPLIAWTVRSQEEYLRVVKYSDNVIFENFEPKI